MFKFNVKFIVEHLITATAAKLSLTVMEVTYSMAKQVRGISRQEVDEDNCF